jgi:hypothetical protein
MFKWSHCIFLLNKSQLLCPKHLKMSQSKFVKCTHELTLNNDQMNWIVFSNELTFGFQQTYHQINKVSKEKLFFRLMEFFALKHACSILFVKKIELEIERWSNHSVWIRHFLFSFRSLWSKCTSTQFIYFHKNIWKK